MCHAKAIETGAKSEATMPSAKAGEKRRKERNERSE